MQAFRYTAGYQPKGGLYPGSLTLTLLISGAIVSAMFFISPHFTHDRETHLIAIPISIDPPPPLQKEPPKPQPKVAPQRELYVTPIPQPVIRDVTAPKVEFTTTPPGPVILDGGDGSGTVATKVDPPKPPVMTGASLDGRFAANFQPVYPADEIRAGRAGRVTVRVLIGTDGHVLQVEKVSAASDSFFEATRRRALDKWRFTPATRDGVPIETWKTVGVTFVLDAP